MYSRGEASRTSTKEGGSVPEFKKKMEKAGGQGDCFKETLHKETQKLEDLQVERNRVDATITRR